MKITNLVIFSKTLKKHLPLKVGAFLFAILINPLALGLPQVESRAGGSPPAEAENSEVRATASMTEIKKIEFLQQEVQELRGKVEEQNYLLQQMQEQQKKLYLDLDRRLREGGPAKIGSVSNATLKEREIQTSSAMQGALDARVSSQFAPKPAATPAGITALPNNELDAEQEKAYQAAYHLIQSKEYDAALVAFKALASTQGKYAPNAIYWLGEIYLVKGNLDLAAQSFDTVYRQYPQHPKAADSLLKLGYVEYSKGRWKQSQAFLNQVKTQFPGSTSAQLAESRLEQMRQEGH